MLMAEKESHDHHFKNLFQDFPASWKVLNLKTYQNWVCVFWNLTHLKILMSGYSSKNREKAWI